MSYVSEVAAVMQEETLDFRDYIDVLLRKWWLLLIGPILGVILVLGFSYAVGGATSDSTGASVYKATALVLMDGTGGLGNSPDLVYIRPVLEGAADRTGLSLSVSELRDKVTARLIEKTNIIEISAEDSQQDRATSIANAVSESLIDYIGTLRTQPVTSSQEFPQPLQDLAYLLAGGGLTSANNRPVVVAPAEVVLQPPVSGVNNTIRNVFLAAFAGALTSVGAVVALEYLRQPVRSPEQFESRCRLASLGRIPRWRNKGKKDFQLVVSSKSSPAAGEAVRKAANNLEFSALPQGPKTLVVVSPHTGDGRSTLLANLGVALADTWNEVVLVDTDLRFPSLHRFFDLDNSTGLTGLLCEPTITIAEVAQETPHKRLKVVTSGPVPPNPLELLRCPRVTWLLEQLKETYDIALLDTPPALAVTDAVALASQADGVILVIDAQSTRWEEMRTVLTGLERVGTPIMGYIWNRATATPWTFLAPWQRYYRKLERNPHSSFTLGNGNEVVDTDQDSEFNAGHLASSRRP
jgi:capsular exopolysaccharide synthesis family protein